MYDPITIYFMDFFFFFFFFCKSLLSHAFSVEQFL